ncbi:hypothetical protein I7I51_01606 [Histoplasma capsulatum]|uniref:Aminoglycoside phosphotransferase domain-containing protein n=1 Tax=Ajellomyces capsulatus TaxID=5037 RepID=A0A8A1MD63_AJECA|nr:hypothetical protein I7I51_01606 [Histoplasma capsulatum]
MGSPNEQPTAPVEVAHIIPFSYANFSAKEEETNTYRIKTYPSFDPIMRRNLPKDRIVRFGTNDDSSQGDLQPPEAELLWAHFAVAEILYASGMGAILRNAIVTLPTPGARRCLTTTARWRLESPTSRCPSLPTHYLYSGYYQDLIFKNNWCVAGGSSVTWHSIGTARGILMAKLESHDVSLISQIPSDASITHGLSPLLANFSQDHVLPGEKLPAESLSAIIQRLNRAIVNSDIIWELGSTSCTRHQPRDSHESWVRYRHRPHPDNEPRWPKMIRSFLISDYKLVMTHGDLHPRNVMVLKPNVSPSDVPADWVEVTGLLDWEMCGYYPEYWEYVKALHTIRPGGSFDDWWAYLPVSIVCVAQGVCCRPIDKPLEGLEMTIVPYQNEDSP